MTQRTLEREEKELRIDLPYIPTARQVRAHSASEMNVLYG